MACFRLVTFFPEPLRSVPTLRSCMTFLTFFCAVVFAELFLPTDFLVVRFAPAALRPVLFAAVLRPALLVDLREVDFFAGDLREAVLRVAMFAPPGDGRLRVFLLACSARAAPIAVLT